MIDYDLELQRHNDVLRRAYGIRASDLVVDIGCGTGQTTREAARLAAEGAVLGIDRSNEMIERARELTDAAKLGNVEYLCGDLEQHALPHASFDVAISRFGTMFFEHPVAAFSNIGRALRPHGRLVMMVWQQRERNEWATAIESAFPAEDARVAGSSPAPLAFSLGEQDFVRDILDSAGFAAPTFDEVHAPVCYGIDVDAAFAFVSGFSTVQDKAARLDGRQREHAFDRLRRLLTEHQGADGVWLDSRAWIVTAGRG